MKHIRVKMPIKDFPNCRMVYIVKNNILVVNKAAHRRSKLIVLVYSQ